MISFKQKLPTYLFIFIYWIITINVLSLASILAIRSFLAYAEIPDEVLSRPLLAYWISDKQFLESMIFSILFSTLFIGVNEASDRFKWERFSFGRLIILKSFIYLLGMVTIFLIISAVISSLGFISFEIIEELEMVPVVKIIFSIIILYIILLVILLNYILQTAKKMGGNNIISFLTGRYHKPVRENRIFLFIDLKSSTSIAEQLGSLKFSSLLKDCFDDLNYIVPKHEGEIYQYVGDEVVITWGMKKGLIKSRFVKLFFDFQKALEKRKGYYLKKYNLLPQFKAGAHGGLITVSEVGNIRREIAYHGDVINTASRIQGLCNQYESSYLVSEFLLDKTMDLNGFSAKALGKVQLKGREKELNLFSIKV